MIKFKTLDKEKISGGAGGGLQFASIEKKKKRAGQMSRSLCIHARVSV